MFTGIVTDIGTVLAVEERGALTLRIGSAYDMSEVGIGASIACSGVCLTVVDKGADWFAVNVSPETLARTAEGLWRQGSRLNLERSLRVGDELGGHIVTGHVDGVAAVVAADRAGGSLELALEVPAALASGIAPKGSVALDGVSLTVNSVEDHRSVARFTVTIIPHTAAHTTLGDAASGRQLNVEIDVLARYLERMLATREAAGA